MTDSTTVATDLRTLADQLARLRDSIQDGSSADGDPDSGPGLGAPDPATAGTLLRVALAVILALLAWLAVPAIAAIEVGRRWRRESRVDSAG